MRIRNLILSVSLLALTVRGADAPSSATPEKVPPDAKPVAPSAANPESTLKQGMPAEVVKKIMGEPLQIRPMKAPDGKAEIWIFRRDVDVSVTRMPVNSIPITVSSIGSDGKAYQQTIGEKVQYGNLYKATEETIQLLMFNDHYLTQKITRREVKHFN